MYPILRALAVWIALVPVLLTVEVSAAENGASEVPVQGEDLLGRDTPRGTISRASAPPHIRFAQKRLYCFSAISSPSWQASRASCSSQLR